MRFEGRERGLSVILIGLCISAPAQAQEPAGRPAKKPPRVSTRNEIQELRSEVAAQRETIEELKALVERLAEAGRQTAGAAQQAGAKAAEAEAAARQAKESGALAARAAEQAGETAGRNQSDLVEVRRTAQADRETLWKSVANARLQAGWDGEHFFIKDSEGGFALQPFGYVQLDYRSYRGTDAPPNTFAIRRGRFGFQGSLGKQYQFTLLADFSNRNSTLAREFSLNVNYLDAFQLKFGQFKEPFSQEELQNAPYIDFVERSPLVNLAPAYSPGVEAHGQLLRGAIQYEIGVFNGKGFLNLNDTSTPEGVLRLRFSPWRKSANIWTKGLSFGGGGSDGRARNGASFSGLLPTRTFNFFKSETVNGSVRRANGEFTWTIGPAALRGEYDQTSQERAALGTGGTNLPGVVAKGYSLSASYLLTGESKPENGQPKPRYSFQGKEGRGISAWELKFRYANLQMEDGTLRNRADQMSTGLNWYPTSLVRYMIDFNVERLKNRVPGPAALEPQSFLSVLQRIQFRF